MGKKAAFFTVGCKVNQYDTESLKEVFRQKGYEIVDFSRTAHVYVVNTCTVTSMADKKSRQHMRQAKRRNPKAIIVATGCYSQTAADTLKSMDEVDIVTGTLDRKKIPALIEKFQGGEGPIVDVTSHDKDCSFEDIGISEFQGRTRAFIKIQDGCRQFCSYCRIPYVRGPLRSRNLISILNEVEKVARAGYKEVVLTGIHVGSYGIDFNKELKVADVLREINNVDGIERIRLSSIEPMEVDDDLIDVIARYPKICRHLHIPLQSGDDYILGLMNRNYTISQYMGIISKVRDKISMAGITTDIMVGFPGEEDKHFRNTLNAVKAMEFSKIHVFKYSKRKGTKAFTFPNQVSSDVKSKRSEELIKIGKSLAQKFYAQYKGHRVEVLFESRDKEMVTGYTDNYIPIRCRTDEDICGQIRDVNLIQVEDDYVIGVLT